MGNPIRNELVRAVRALNANSRWRDMLADNIFVASCEGFLQSSILSSFAARSTVHFADRERVLAKYGWGFQPDLIIVARRDHAAYWEARRKRDKVALARMSRAVLQLTVAWTPGWGTASAAPAAKANKFAADLVQIGQFVSDNRHCRGYLAAVVSGESRAAVEGTTRLLLGAVEGAVSGGAPNDMWLLNGWRPKHWGVWRTGTRLWSQFRLLSVRRR